MSGSHFLNRFGRWRNRKAVLIFYKNTNCSQNETCFYSTSFQKLNPNESIYYQQRGNCYKEKEEFEMAVDDYRMALRCAPSNKKIFSLLIRTLFDLERFEEAVEGKILYRFRNIKVLKSNSAWNICSSYNTEALAFDDIDEVLELGHKLSSLEVYKEAVRCYTAAIVSIKNIILSILNTRREIRQIILLVGVGYILKIIFRSF